jgi:hypothetical protein
LLSIDSDLEVPGELDAIALTLTASRTVEGALCEATERSFDLEEPEDVPLLIELTPGASYDSWVAFRAVGSAGGVELVRVENRVPWPVGGPASFTIELAAACLDLVPCGADEQCIEGRCAAIPSPGVFDGRFPVDEGVPCDAGEPEEAH